MELTTILAVIGGISVIAVCVISLLLLIAQLGNKWKPKNITDDILLFPALICVIIFVWAFDKKKKK